MGADLCYWQVLLQLLHVHGIKQSRMEGREGKDLCSPAPETLTMEEETQQFTFGFLGCFFLSQSPEEIRSFPPL